MISSDLPQSNSELRQSIYAGTIYRIGPDSHSRRLTEAVRQIVNDVLGDNYRQEQFRLNANEFSTALQQIKKAVYTSASLKLYIGKVLSAHGFQPSQHAFDPVRIRAVTHNGHEQSLAWAAYSHHRDTWYANPQCQINWWIPLHDVAKEETFSFFPSYFKQPIANSSADFDYKQWSAAVGFGNSNNSETSYYPTVTESVPPDSPALGFACSEAEIILFSAAHLHATNPNRSGKTRFSMDFRVVNLEDYSLNRGAPNVDNESTGSALVDYERFEAIAAQDTPV